MSNPAAALPRNPAFRRDVQGLRAVAVVAVILYHARQLLPGGYVGVDVFFVISGFVITRSLSNEYARRHRISLIDFYRRRVRRLTPMLTVAVVAVVTLSAVLAPIAALRRTALTAISASLLGANVYLERATGYFNEAAELNPLLHTWSLSLEEQFYLVFPLVVVALLSSPSAKAGRRLRAGLVGLSLLSFALSLTLSSGLFDDVVSQARGTRLAFFAMPTRAWQFGVGAVLATFPDSLYTSGRASAWRGIAGSLLLAVSVVTLHDELVYPGYWALLPTCATALLLASPTGPVARLLSGRRMTRMGDLSYSWYLWHWPFIVFAFAAGVDTRLGLAIAGFASYWLSAWTYDNIETRFRESGSKAPRRNYWAPVMATSVIAVSIASVALLMWSAKALPAPARLAGEAEKSHADLTCVKVPLGAALTGCAFGSGERRLVLLGDSNAGHITEAAVRAGAELGYAVEVVTQSVCPLLPVRLLDAGQPQDGCEVRSQAVLEWLLADPPDVLIHSAAVDIYLTLDRWTLERKGLTGPAAYSDALRNFIEPLESRGGVGVVVVLPIPKFALTSLTIAGAQRCSVASLATSPVGCELTTSKADAEQQRAPAVEAIRSALASTNAVVLDPMSAVCPTDPCREFRGDFWRYRDARHISVQMADEMAPLLVSALDEALRAA